MSNKKRRPGRPSKYPPEFQRDAVAMVLDEGRSIADVARSIGVVEGTLGNWVAKARREREADTGLSVDERVELAGPTARPRSATPCWPLGPALH
jgi:transposase-like protein